MSDPNNVLPETVQVFTSLHGRDPLGKREGVLSDTSGCYNILLPNKRNLWFIVPNPRMVEHNHFFLFDGLTIEGGMSPRVKHLKYALNSDGEPSLVRSSIAISTKCRHAAKWENGDCGIDALHSWSRNNVDGDVIQKVRLHLVAVPKGDERFVFLAFRTDSLEPYFRMVRSIPQEIIVQNAVSY